MINLKNGLNSLKSKVGKLDICKFETTPIDLNKLSDTVKNDAQKGLNDELVKQVNAIKTTDTSD